MMAEVFKLLQPFYEKQRDFKVARYPVFSRSTNLESKLIVFFVLLKFLAHSPFWESQTVHGP